VLSTTKVSLEFLLLTVLCWGSDKVLSCFATKRPVEGSRAWLRTSFIGSLVPISFISPWLRQALLVLVGLLIAG